MADASFSNFTLTKISDNNFRISWTALATDKNYIYRNGVLLKFDTSSDINRYVDFTAEESELSVIEVHVIPNGYTGDINSTTGFASITEKVQDLLFLHWDRVSDAVTYNIYYQEANGPEGLIKIVAQDTETQQYRWAIPRLKSIEGVWHHFRVEAVDSWGNQSTTLLWHHYVYGLPQFPSDVLVTGGSGIFDFQLVF